MKYRAFLLFSFLILAAVSYGQLGIRGGVTVSAASVSFSDGRPDVETSNDMSFTLGLFYKINLGTDFLSLQPEINYMGKGYQYEISSGPVSYSYDSRQFDVGGLVRLNFELGPLGTYIGAGPFYSYDLTASITELGDERDVDFDVEPIRRDNIAVAAALGFYLDAHKTIFIEARFIGDLNDADTLSESEIKQRSYMFTGGFMF